MLQEKVTFPEKKIVGLKIRTNNETEKAIDKGKIFPCVQNYFHNNFAEKIQNRRSAGVTLCIYTEYESDHTGDYTYFIGEEVDSFENQPDTLSQLLIPEQTYIKFTNGPGAMPQVILEPWFKIWQMTPEDFGGKRNYKADFEVYDERSADHSNITLDICIGITEN